MNVKEGISSSVVWEISLFLSDRVSLYIMCINSSVPRSSSIMPYLFFFSVCLVLLECGIDYNVQLVIHALLQIDLFAEYQSL